MWTESNDLEHVGFLSFGFNSIVDFEVYRSKSTGELLFCDHDNADFPCTLDDIRAEFEASDHPRYAEQNEENRQVLAKLGVVI